MFHLEATLKIGQMLVVLCFISTAQAQTSKVEHAIPVKASISSLPWQVGEDDSETQRVDLKKEWIAAHPEQYKRKFDCSEPLEISRKEFDDLGEHRQKILLKDHENMKITE